jgi:hypothetical protein
MVRKNQSKRCVRQNLRLRDTCNNKNGRIPGGCARSLLGGLDFLCRQNSATLPQAED